MRLISGESKSHLKNKLNELSGGLKNSFKHIKNWVKIEIMTLQTLIQAIGEKESCTARKSRAIKKLASNRELISSINQGKFAFQTAFKSQNSKSRYQADLLAENDQLEKDIENWEKIKKILTIYLAEVAIPYYKSRKTDKYVGAILNFSYDEMLNAETHLACWGDFKNYTDALLGKKLSQGGVWTQSYYQTTK